MSKQNELAQLANAVTVDGSNVNERMELKSGEVNWTNSTDGFYNKIWGPSSGDISSGYLTYCGSTVRGGFYTNPTHGLTVISDVDMSFRANNANRLHIDTSGRVTMPYQPSFRVSKTSSPSGNQTVVFDNVHHNIGGHYNTSNGRFTAPVAGSYYFAWQGISASSTTTNEQNVNISVNNVGICDSRFLGYTQSGGQVITVIDLNVNDYVSVGIGNNSTSLYGQPLHNQFMGYLLG